MIYEYQCIKCKHIQEIYTTKYDLKETDCEKCGKKAVRILSPANFKGDFR